MSSGLFAAGKKELRRVRQVECFSAKLQIEPFGKEEIADQRNGCHYHAGWKKLIPFALRKTRDFHAG
ncbi:MAG: hypothetical protein JO029_11930 [Candidatus Eremiobacteraeota bacterium]|nr:hypothetical protein [Candidatus Eremiobacteraeota bacterium]